MPLLLIFLLAACAPNATPVPPTNTPRPTLPPREPPTPIPTAVAAGDITPGETVTVTLPGRTYVRLLYRAEQEQVVTITGEALSDDGAGNPLDVVIEVLDVNSQRVAYDDDGGRDLEGLAPTDAALQNLRLPPGTYTVRVNAFNGFQGGEVAVTLTPQP